MRIEKYLTRHNKNRLWWFYEARASVIKCRRLHLTVDQDLSETTKLNFRKSSTARRDRRKLCASVCNKIPKTEQLVSNLYRCSSEFSALHSEGWHDEIEQFKVLANGRVRELKKEETPAMCFLGSIFQVPEGENMWNSIHNDDGDNELCCRKS